MKNLKLFSNPKKIVQASYFKRLKKFQIAVFYCQNILNLIKDEEVFIFVINAMLLTGLIDDVFFSAGIMPVNIIVSNL